MLHLPETFSCVVYSSAASATNLKKQIKTVEQLAGLGIASALPGVSPLTNITSRKNEEMQKEIRRQFILLQAGLEGVNIDTSASHVFLNKSQLLIENFVHIEITHVELSSLKIFFNAHLNPRALSEELQRHGSLNTVANLAGAIAALALVALSFAQLSNEIDSDKFLNETQIESVVVPRTELENYCVREIRDLSSQVAELSNAENVASLQRLLDADGFSPGWVDGVIGPATLNAVSRAAIHYSLTDETAKIEAQEIDAELISALIEVLITSHMRKTVPGCDQVLVDPKQETA